MKIKTTIHADGCLIEEAFGGGTVSKFRLVADIEFDAEDTAEANRWLAQRFALVAAAFTGDEVHHALDEFQFTGSMQLGLADDPRWEDPAV